jgi:VWFA-related protein
MIDSRPGRAHRRREHLGVVLRLDPSLREVGSQEGQRVTVRCDRRSVRCGRDRACILAASLLSLASPTISDEPPGQPVPSGLTETIEVRLVEIPVLALDADGHPVSDLAVQDLELRINGSPREIAFVRRAVQDPDPDRILPSVRLGIETGGPDEGATTRPNAPRYYLLFLDLTNEPLPRGSDAHEGISRFLREEVTASDFVGVMSYTGRVWLDLPFTSEPHRPSEAVARAFERPRPAVMNARQRVELTSRTLEQCNHIWDSPLLAGAELQEFLSAGEDRPVAETGCVRGVAMGFLSDMNSQGRRFLEAVEAAIQLAGTVRGGATVLAVSHGVTLQPSLELEETYRSVFGPGQVWKIMDASTADMPVADALERLVAMGVDQGVSLSFLDPSRPPAGSRGAREDHLIAAGTNPVEAAYLAPRTELLQIASSTGGVFLADTDLYDGLRRVAARERGRYILGFYTDRPLSESDARRIEVAAAHRRIALEMGRAYDVRTRSARRASGTFVHGESRALSDGREGRFLSFRLDARVDDLDYETVGEDAAAADLSLHVRVLTADGQPLTDSYRFFRHTVPAARPGRGKTPVLAVRGWLEADPGIYRLEAMFRNPRSGSEVGIFHEFEVAASEATVRLGE